MDKKLFFKNYSVLLFSFVISFVTYGFALTNYSLTVDSESPAFSDYSMGLGRWGTNLIRYRIFEGHLPYFTLLLGLIFLSLSAVELSKIFKLKGVSSFIFCALFLTLPQHAYQLAFTMQADAVPIGFFFSILGVTLFIKNIDNIKKPISLALLIISSLFILFGIAVYQALIFMPVVTYLVYFFINLSNPEFNFKTEILKLLKFAVLMIISIILYYISVKMFCPPVEGGYLSSYTSGNTNDRFVDFYNLWVDNIRGNFYYGNKTFVFSSLACLGLIASIVIEKKNILLKIICLLVLFILPFFISFFITNGSHPPRLYVSSGIIYAFIITYTIKVFKKEYFQPLLFGVLLIIIANIYFITNLFYSNYKIFHHDLEVAKKIDNTILNKYPEFNPNLHYVYFYGSLPQSNHDKLKIPNSDVFGGSLFCWDGGNNWRIINFFRYNDVAYYKFLDNKEAFDQVKDSIQSMPLWPSPESVKKINNVVVVKIGDTKGTPLPFE